jgi:hypothetical protein
MAASVHRGREQQLIKLVTIGNKLTLSQGKHRQA